MTTTIKPSKIKPLLIFTAIIYRDFRLAYRHRAELLQPLAFYVLVVSLFPLAVPPDPQLLIAIGPGIIWIAVLLATLLSLNYIFSQDFTDGCLEQLVLSPQSLVLLVLAKIIAHWLITSLPLIVLTPLLALSLHLSVYSIKMLIISLLLGTPSLSLIGAIMVALTVGLRHSGVLLALLIMPLYIPVLILGVSLAMVSPTQAMNAQLAALTALLILAFTLAPWATAAALKVAVAE